MRSNQAEPICLFLCGDVLTGRGVDQVLPHQGNRALHEYSVRDARRYVELTERVHGPIQRPVEFGLRGWSAKPLAFRLGV
jgi:poly-gamma-glutamate synthesis protein (capsule biosynthesis protein)